MVLFGGGNRKGTIVRKLLALSVILTISGCSGGSTGSAGSMGNLNPFNWFGGNKTDEVALTPRGGFAESVDRRPRVGQIVKITLERTSFGVILHANALLPSQGYFDLDLVQSDEARSDQLVFDFRAWPPQTPTVAGTPRQRELTAAIFLSSQTIRGIREIVVVGATNSLSRRP